MSETLKKGTKCPTCDNDRVILKEFFHYCLNCNTGTDKSGDDLQFKGEK